MRVILLLLLFFFRLEVSRYNRVFTKPVHSIACGSARIDGGLFVNIRRPGSFSLVGRNAFVFPLPALAASRFSAHAVGAALLLVLMALTGTPARAQVNVYTRSYNNARTGANLNETVLTPANVTPSQFGKLFAVKTDGQIYAQPLYVSNLYIAGGTHNVVFVATMNNSVYALDADTGARLWARNFGTPINPQEVESDQNVSWNTGMGILSTPVIDPDTNIMYFVSGNESQVNGAKVYQNHLNAIEIATGQPVAGSPVNITASYSTPDLIAPLVFNAMRHNQRPGLALSRGNVYIAYASHEDQLPYHGWVIAYNESTLAQVAAYSDTTTGIEGGIWMAGAAPAVDANGNLFLSTGNGSFGATPNRLVQTGNSFIELSPSLELMDYFTPRNSASMNSGDMDLGASGLLLVPNTSRVIGGGKQGVLYMADTLNLGKFNSSEDRVLQEFQAVYGVGTSHIHGAPVYFDGEANGPMIYLWGENDVLRAFQFNGGGYLNADPFATSTMTAPIRNNDGAMPGGFLSISANGNNDGIVWASTPYVADAVHQVVQGVLYAFDASTLQLLWTDKANDARDEIGRFAKYCPPVVANGKLYMATFGPNGTQDGSGALVVYGLLPRLTVDVANASMTAGAALPAFNSTVYGLLNGDKVGATLAVNYSTTATTSSPAGQYPITATVTGTSAQYYRVFVNSGTLTINQPGGTGGGPPVSYQNGFAAGSIQANGAAKINGTRLRLTDGGAYEAASAFYPTPVNVQSFTNDFTFQLTSPSADGFTFVIQNAGKTALGPSGGGLGYGPDTAQGTGGIAHSVAFKFDLYNNSGEGLNSTGLYTGGASPTSPATDVLGSGISLHSGDIFQVHESYDGTTLTVILTDTSTGKSDAETYTIDIPGTVGAATAYVGFTGGTGGDTATQDILTWTYAPQPYYPKGFSSTQITLNGAALNGTNLRLTDGGGYEARSAFFAAPVNVQQFTSNFTFQLSNPSADGFAFVIQNAGPNAVGALGGGLGYGPDGSGRTGQIAKSVAVKFDLYSNAGEGIDSTGLYVNGASPTTPSIDLSATGINLHSGHVFAASLTYGGSILTVAITDTVTHASATQTYSINIPGTVGGTHAYVGFTAGTGGAVATQDIQSWTFNETPSQPYYPSGFSGGQLTLNGGTALNGTKLRLTDGGANESRSAFFTQPLSVRQFTSSFTFQLTNPNADGFAFVIQGVGPQARGALGGGLGYGPDGTGNIGQIARSVAVKFDLYSNAGEGIDSTGIYVNGASPTMPSINLSRTGINLHSGHVFSVRLIYAGSTLTSVITDTVTNASATQTYTVDIPGAVGNSLAYVGFTAGTGGATATQDIQSWTYNATFN